MSFPSRTELVAENTIFGTKPAAWKGRLWGKSLLEENIRTITFTTGRSHRLLCIGLYIQSFEWQSNGTVLRLPARKLYWCRLHFTSACLVRTFCIISEDHKCVSHSMPISMHYFIVRNLIRIFVPVSALHTIQNKTYIKLGSATTRILKKQLQSKKRTYPLKNWTV